MSTTVVIQLPTDEIEKMQAYYRSALSEKSPAGSLFLAKLPGCTITAYRSQKVLFQGKHAEQEASLWQAKAISNGDKTGQQKAKRHQWSPPDNLASLSLIGSDEVGTGDYFGPMTVAAAFIDKADIPLMQSLGVKDSKYLSDKEIVSIAKQLIKTIPYSSLLLSNEKYNDLERAGMNQGKMKALLHNRALLHVIKKINNQHDGVLIDQFTKPDTYFRYLSSEQEIITSVYFATQAESLHLSVAAASIIARYRFLKEMDTLSEKIGVTLPKGAGQKVDEVAAMLIRQHDEAILYHYAKLHFANTEKALHLVEKL